MDNIIVALAAFFGTFAAVYFINLRREMPRPPTEDGPRARLPAAAAIIAFAAGASLLFYLMSSGAMAASLGMIALATTLFLSIAALRFVR